MEWTNKNIKSKTNSNKMKYQHSKDMIQHYEMDDEKENRDKSMVCKYCFYLRSVCGFSAMTTSYCGICEEPILNGSSDTNIVCDKCAGNKDLCTCCGGEMD